MGHGADNRRVDGGSRHKSDRVVRFNRGESCSQKTIIMNVLRAWATCSPSCRPMALRMTAQRLDTKLFSTAARNTSVVSHFFSATGLRRPPNADILSKLSTLFSRHSSSPRRAHPAPSRLGWYRESTGWRGQSVKRPSGLSGAGRSSFDPQSPSPLKRFRRWFDQFPSEFIVWGIIGLNGAVFFAWQYAKDQAVCSSCLLQVQRE